MSKSRTVTLSYVVEHSTPETVEVQQTVVFDHEARDADAIRTDAIRVGSRVLDVIDAIYLRDALSDALEIAAADFGDVAS